MSTLRIPRLSLTVRGLDAATVEAALERLPEALERHLDALDRKGAPVRHPGDGTGRVTGPSDPAPAAGPTSPLHFAAPPTAPALAEALARHIAAQSHRQRSTVRSAT